MFDALPTPVSFPKLEEQVLEFWRERKIYEESLARRKGAPKFVFYEGPPTANGKPHPGHCLTRAIKDIFPRYRTMRGYFCERKAGWDTHGLPVEVEVCKELGIHAKEEIEAFGIEPFIHKCQESVWRYMQEWERMTERLGFWVNLKDAYVTYHQSFIESVWWSLKTLFDRGLLYQGHKIVWWWAQGGTALSSGEVGLGYREVADPSVYVKFPLLDDAGKKTDTSLLVWTTTPWTLPSNQFAAVHPELDYVTVVDEHEGKSEKLIMAAALVETIAGKVKREFKIESTCKGSALLGRRYVPPFDYYYASKNPEVGNFMSRTTRDTGEHVAWRVVPGDFVTTDSGTGVVHIAPAFGEVDYNVLETERKRFQFGGPTLINAVGPDGKFTADAPDYQGRWVKDCDKDISRRLKDEGKLFHQEQYLHEYPFCWRAEQDPLIQYPRRSWFIRTSRFKEEMLANNAEVNWLPEHIKEGRFGNFLASNVDWALSRERYWGTPLPIWVCEQTGKMEAIGGYDELLAKKGVQGTEVWEAAKKAKPGLVEDLKVHKPYIDEITYDSPFAPGARMKRVTEVIDCWYDSGAMPFAQWGYPHDGQEKFRTQFPADFISEAIDQTRGWFYSQLAISTLLFGRSRLPGGTSANESAPSPPPGSARQAEPTEYPHPFRTCIVLGLMLAEWWESKDGKQVFLTEEDAAAALGPNVAAHRVGKMSKQKRNYREPQEIFDRYGADALRWYFFANQAPWTSIRYSERAIRDSIPEFLLRLWNCYSFFVIYANIDGFDPGQRLLAGHVGDLKGEAFRLGKGWREVSERAELDRWILSELNRTAAAVVERMDAYDNFNAAQAINAFVDALSNWYVRRSRDRYWATEKESPDKLDAYWTLYECLITTSKLIAPFVPFLAEALWQNLAGVFQGRALKSVHLADYPTGDASAVDENLSARMNLMREITSLGLRARMGAKLKVRQPLSKLEIILASPEHREWLRSHDAILRDELNVKQIEYTEEADKYITYEIQPNFKLLGPRLGKLLPRAKQVLGKANGAALLAEMRTKGKVTLELGGERIELDANDIQVRLKAKPGWVAEDSPHCVVVLSTELTPELIREGYARDFVRMLQEFRKEMGLVFTDRISVTFDVDNPEVARAITEYVDFIKTEVLATQLGNESVDVPIAQGTASTSATRDFDIGGSTVRVAVSRSL